MGDTMTAEQLWKQRLKLPVMCAALLAIPAVALHTAYHKGQAGYAAGDVLSWVVWSVFCAEVLIMTRVADEPRRWMRSHRFEMLIVALSFPLLTVFMEGVLAARLLPMLKIAKGGKLLKLVKIGKLIKSVKLVRGGWQLTGLRLGLVAGPAGVVAAAIMQQFFAAKGEHRTVLHDLAHAAGQISPWAWLALAFGVYAAVRLNVRRVRRLARELDAV